jgi:uncharacterized protein
MKMSAYTIPFKIEEDQYLLINSLTGAVTLVDQHTIKLLQDGPPDIFGVSSPIIEALKKDGHYTSLNPAEEAKEISHLYKMYVQTHRRMYTHMVMPTYDCNLNCSYCSLSHLRHHKDTPYTVIDDDHIDALLTAVTYIDGDYTGQVVLSGGEPLLVENYSVVEKILHKLNRRGYDVTVATNGLSVHDFVDILTKYAAALEIPLDGPKEVHDSRRIKRDGTGTFDEVVTGIDESLDAGITVFLRVNLDESNIQGFPQMMDFFRKKGWYDNPGLFLHLSPVFQNSCKRNEPFTLRKTFYHDFIFHMVQHPDTAPFFHIRGIEMIGNVFLKGELGPPRFWYCEANSGVLIYGPSGDIYACYGHVGDESTKIGRYYPELSWNESYDSWKQRIVFTIPACKNCPHALLCGGGCGFEALKGYGTLSKPVCPDYQALTRAVPQLYNIMKGK